MKHISGKEKNLRQLLQNTKYTIHYYQREYMWQRKHIEELVDDLTSEFLEFYHHGDPRNSVQDYGVYFMGSVVLAGRENAIIDGQQRFSSLTLLLIYLNNRLKKIGEQSNIIETMIFSESYGSKSFNINVDDRQSCMEALFKNEDFDISKANESIKNLYNRYKDIEDIFPESIKDGMLLHFCDWLVEKVYFIEIVAAAEQDAHKVFVSMNDRGLSLTSTEMLKGYILSEIKDDKNREYLNSQWKDKILQLKATDDKGDETFIKSWLRAQYAQTIRETKAGATNKDFDLIGGPFHKWVRDEKEKLSLSSSDSYENFIKKMVKFADVYLQIKSAETTYNEKTKFIYYNAQLNFTLQTQMLLAPICDVDDSEKILAKINLVARFIDLLIVSRVTNYKSLDYSTIKNYIFSITKDIRHSTIPELKEKLLKHINDLNIDITKSLPNFKLNGYTKKYIKHMLARITGFIEENIGVASNYCNYVNTQTKNPFEIEHIITDHYEWFTNEYSDQDDFHKWRNNIGSLLLLHKSINASLQDKLYDYKLNKYCSNEGNIYTETLGKQAYINNPRFKKFISDYDLPFVSYQSFGKKEILERNNLFTKLATLVWNTNMFTS